MPPNEGSINTQRPGSESFWGAEQAEIQGQCHAQGASHVILGVKNVSAHPRDIKDSVSIPASGRPPGGGRSNPPQVFLPGESHGQRILAGS